MMFDISCLHLTNEMREQSVSAVRACSGNTYFLSPGTGNRTVRVVSRLVSKYGTVPPGTDCTVRVPAKTRKISFKFPNSAQSSFYSMKQKHKRSRQRVIEIPTILIF
jgi:hypothetical protein